jgi:hypothetical protein
MFPNKLYFIFIGKLSFSNISNLRDTSYNKIFPDQTPKCKFF